MEPCTLGWLIGYNIHQTDEYLLHAAIAIMIWMLSQIPILQMFMQRTVWCMSTCISKIVHVTDRWQSFNYHFYMKQKWHDISIMFLYSVHYSWWKSMILLSLRCTILSESMTLPKSIWSSTWSTNPTLSQVDRLNIM